MADRTQMVKTAAVAFVALLVGVVAGVAGTQAWNHAHRATWIEAGGQWVRLPSQAPAGSLPQTFTTPAKAWDYGASTRALPPTVTENAPVIVRVDVAAASGPVGVSLAKPDGSALISKEKAVPSGAGPMSLYFRQARPADIAVLVRNYDGQGRAGSITVNDVRYAVESQLLAKELGKMNKAGID